MSWKAQYMDSFLVAIIESFKPSPTVTRICFSVVNCFSLRNVISYLTTVVIQLFSTRSRYIFRKGRTRISWRTSRITSNALNDDSKACHCKVKGEDTDANQ